MNDQKKLAPLRREIDALDDEIIALINRRAQKVLDISAAKKDNADQRDYYRPERESEVLRRIAAQNQGPMSAQHLQKIFREVMTACLILQRPIHIAYLGPEGTFTQEAVAKHFGDEMPMIAQPTIGDVFVAVNKGDANYGVVPVENSTEGMVQHTLDLFLDSPLHIVGEVELKISLLLMARKATKIEQVHKICAHQQALAQCGHWLDQHCPHVERQAVSSNGEAARYVSEVAGYAAIAGELAAQYYHLDVLARDIEDNVDNTTRFLILGLQTIPMTGKDKTSIIVTLHNEVGALYRLLKFFNDMGVSLTRISSHPARTEKWSYIFFIEFEGHCEQEPIREILQNIQSESAIYKFLGSYPQAVL